MKPQADVGLMFAESPAVWAAEDQVKAIQSDLPSVRLCLQRQELNPALISVSTAQSKSVLFFSHMFKHILCTTV